MTSRGTGRLARASVAVFLFAGAALLQTVALPSSAQVTTSTAPAASADAYGLLVDVRLTPLNIPVAQGPLARATQDSPPGADGPDEAELLATGQIPSGGAAVDNVGVLTSSALANSTPRAVAYSQAVDVRLLNQAGMPLITADVLRAQSATDCAQAPSAAGTEFVNLRVAGQVDPIPTPAPNTVLLPALFDPLGIRVVLNEQHPTADGRGLVVNAIHIYQVAGSPLPPLFTGDLIVSHAMSTVNCPNGAGTTGADNPIFIEKTASTAAARHGEQLTYTATFRNNDDVACVINQAVDHLPTAFEFVSTSGDLGTTATTANRPGGGTDVIIEPAPAVSIPPSGSVTQTFVVKVKGDAPLGVYFNNVELLCGNLGNWVKGLDAPVEIVAQPAATTTAPPAPPTSAPPRELPKTGGGLSPLAAAAIAAAVLAAAGAGLRRRIPR